VPLVTAPRHHREAARLEALRLYRILDTEAEKSFDDLASLASVICGSPISLVSLVDDGRQWFKARVGMRATETSRDVAFCAHAILQSDVMIVPDAMADERFADNPLVLTEPHIRFYAGAPLITPDGLPVGTLCVFDRVPRRLTREQIAALEVLRDAVVAQLELRRKLLEVADLAAERDAGFRALAQQGPVCPSCGRVDPTRSDQPESNP
jgi:GAF domain-containing protein